PVRPLRKRGAHLLGRLSVGTRHRCRGRPAPARRSLRRAAAQRPPHAVRHARAGHRRRARPALRGTHRPRPAAPHADGCCLAPWPGRRARSHRSASRPVTTALDHLLAELTAAGAHALTATNPHAARCRPSRENLAGVTARIPNLVTEGPLHRTT